MLVLRIALAITKDNSTRVKMVTDGVATPSIALLRHPSCTLEMHRDATHAIAELASHDVCESALVDGNVILILALLINSGNNQDILTVSSARCGLRNSLGGQKSIVVTVVLADKYSCITLLLALVASEVTLRVYIGDKVINSVAAVSNFFHQR